MSDNWREDYNFNHPHKSLGNISPKEFIPDLEIP
ncbi:integrase core domain-containing protein [Tenacibaculum sediminilitoris]